jgi:transcriptional regulator with XRE-family HTH domain
VADRLACVATTPNSIFGEIIYYSRRKLGLTQEKLAAESFLSRDYISKIENGKRGPSLKVVSKLAPPLKKTPLELHKTFLDRLHAEGLYEKWRKSRR